MRFHVLYRQGPNPPAEAVDDLARGSMDWAQQLLSSGKMETTSLFADGGGFAIFNADTPEELLQLIHSNPSSAYLRHEARPCLSAPDPSQREGAVPGLDDLRSNFGDTLNLADQIVAQRSAGGGGTPPAGGGGGTPPAGGGGGTPPAGGGGTPPAGGGGTPPSGGGGAPRRP